MESLLINWQFNCVNCQVRTLLIIQVLLLFCIHDNGLKFQDLKNKCGPRRHRSLSNMGSGGRSDVHKLIPINMLRFLFFNLLDYLWLITIKLIIRRTALVLTKKIGLFIVDCSMWFIRHYSEIDNDLFRLMSHSVSWSSWNVSIIHVGYCGWFMLTLETEDIEFPLLAPV